MLLGKVYLFILNSDCVTLLRFGALSVAIVTVTHPLILIQAGCGIPIIAL